MHSHLKIMTGLLPVAVLSIFMMAPFVPLGRRDVFLILGLLGTVFFYGSAPFAKLKGDAAFQRFCSLLILALGAVVFAVWRFSDSESMIVAVCGAAVPVCVGLSMITWGRAILCSEILRDRTKAWVTVTYAFLALIVLAAGPFLIGLPVLYLFEHGFQ